MRNYLAFKYVTENGLLGEWWSYSGFKLLVLAAVVLGACAVASFADGKFAKGICFLAVTAVCVCYLIYRVQGFMS